MCPNANKNGSNMIDTSYRLRMFNSPLCQNTDLRLCQNENGSYGLYAKSRRNNFWPNFTHPRSLPCNRLYR